MGAEIIHSVPKNYYIMLDLKKSVSNTDFEVVEGDTENHIHITLTDDGEAVDLTGYHVTAVFTHSKGCYWQDSEDASGGITIDDNTIDLHLKTRSFSSGRVQCELRIYGDVLTQSTTPVFNFGCRAALISDETVQSLTDFGILSGIIERVTNLMNTAQNTLTEYSQIPFTDIVYTNTNPSTTLNPIISKQPGQYMGVFCSSSSRPHSASDYTWIQLTPPQITSAAVDSNGNLVLTKTDASTITVSDFSSSLNSRINTALSAQAPIKAQNVTVQPSAFSADNTYRGYGYAAAVPVSGMASTYTGSVVFSPEDVQSGNFAPIAAAGTDCIYIYARRVPNSTVTIPLVKGER